MGELGQLPDLLKPGLDLVFVGTNPGLTSSREGHYFATPTNRFWRAANAAGIFDPPLDAGRDQEALAQGIGFTDVVKRPTASASALKARDFRPGALLLQKGLLACAPRLLCINGLTALAAFSRYAEGASARVSLGLQDRTIGSARVFAAPSPSLENASYSLEDLTGWYGRLASLLRVVRESDR